jgi:TPR repeat protein
VEEPRVSFFGFCYEKGLGGLQKSEEMALTWYRRAADKGERGAQRNLGFYYKQGRGQLTKSDNEAPVMV